MKILSAQPVSSETRLIMIWRLDGNRTGLLILRVVNDTVVGSFPTHLRAPQRYLDCFFLSGCRPRKIPVTKQNRDQDELFSC